MDRVHGHASPYAPTNSSCACTERRMNPPLPCPSHRSGFCNRQSFDQTGHAQNQQKRLGLKVLCPKGCGEPSRTSEVLKEDYNRTAEGGCGGESLQGTAYGKESLDITSGQTLGQQYTRHHLSVLHPVLHQPLVVIAAQELQAVTNRMPQAPEFPVAQSGPAARLDIRNTREGGGLRGNHWTGNGLRQNDRTRAPIDTARTPA